MAATLKSGQRTWTMSRDGEGHREYKIVHVVRCLATDGPYVVINCPGLPQPGQPWLFDGDSDPWAFCKPEAVVRPMLEGEPNTHWTVEQTFTTNIKSPRCQDNPVGDPLTEAPKVSGGFSTQSEEKTVDRFNTPMENSAKEQIRGPQVEFDDGRPTVKIEQNVPLLQLDLLGQMIHTVNDADLWGFPARCVKLSRVSWEKKYYGTCYPYYTRSLEFDVNWATFDKAALDEGTMCLRGDWERNTPAVKYGTWVVATNPATGVPYTPNRPGHFQKFKDWNGENARVILDGFGRPWDPRLGSVDAEPLGVGVPDSLPGQINLEYYPQSNFLLLGIPATL